MDGRESTSAGTRPAAGGVRNMAVLGLLSRTGPEAPPPSPLEEPTQHLPVVRPLRVAARTVIVYERRSWGLLVLTVVLVALTAGVILGQTVAYQPRSVSAAAGVAPTETAYSAPPASASVPTTAATSVDAVPVSGQRISAPLDSRRDRSFEVGGGATLVTVRSADLGDRLYEITTLDGSAVPKIVSRTAGPRLEFVRTGAPGRVGAQIQLNSRVRWTLRLAGGAAEQNVDLRAGKVAAIHLVGGAARATLQLPIAEGTVPVTVTGGVSELDVQAIGGVPVRLRLDKGADTATVDGTTHHRVRSGTTLTSAGWTTTRDRYDVAVSVRMSAVHIGHA